MLAQLRKCVWGGCACIHLSLVSAWGLVADLGFARLSKWNLMVVSALLAFGLRLSVSTLHAVRVQTLSECPGVSSYHDGDVSFAFDLNVQSNNALAHTWLCVEIRQRQSVGWIA